MVLASTPEVTSLEKLAEMANKVVEVTISPADSQASDTPTIAAASATPDVSDEIGQLRSECLVLLDLPPCSLVILVRILARHLVHPIARPPLSRPTH